MFTTFSGNQPQGYLGFSACKPIGCHYIKYKHIPQCLATFSEVALIYQLAHVIRLLNLVQAGWLDILSCWMVVQVVLSQFYAWSVILTGRLMCYFYEELGWIVIYAANTIASACLYANIGNLGQREILIHLNLFFGVIYLPWQLIHLRILRSNARRQVRLEGIKANLTANALVEGLGTALHVKNRTVEPQAWGSLVGIIWMTGYWATLIPV